MRSRPDGYAEGADVRQGTIEILKNRGQIPKQPVSGLGLRYAARGAVEEPQS